MFIVRIIKEIIHERQLTNDNLKLEDLPYVLSLEAMICEISKHAVDVKEMYVAQAHSLWNHTAKLLPISPVLRRRRARLSLNDATKLFEYLEIIGLIGIGSSSENKKY